MGFKIKSWEPVLQKAVDFLSSLKLSLLVANWTSRFSRTITYQAILRIQTPVVEADLQRVGEDGQAFPQIRKGASDGL